MDETFCMNMNNLMIIRRAKHFFENPRYMVGKLFYRYFPDRMPDKWYLEFLFHNVMGYRLDLKNPKTFNEKLQWLKLYDRNPLYTTLVDKVEVKKWVADKIGEQYVIPTLGVYESFDDIDFDKLPDQFVLKCTHDSGSVVICKDKRNFDFQHAKSILDGCLHRNFYSIFREWAYKNVKPRILAETYLTFGDGKQTEICDYKFFCFNGTVKFFKIDFDRFVKHGANYYNRESELLPFGEAACPPNFQKEIIIPSTINKMISLAEAVSEGKPFLRVDFYCIKDKVFFGECTFYPAAGSGKFEPEEWDYKIGEMLILPKRKFSTAYRIFRKQ